VKRATAPNATEGHIATATDGDLTIEEHAMAKAKPKPPQKSNTEIRQILLQYFYDRNRNANSARGKKGSAVKISDVKRELKANHNLTQQEVQSNLTYLLSQGWVAEVTIEKEFQTARGTVMPAVTSFFQITAAGIDKIEGPGEFTLPKFHGIKIEATGQNVITLGDGNQINAKFGELGTALADLRDAIAKSHAPEVDKMNLVADIETVQSQLAKPTPNHSIISAAWSTIKGAAIIAECIPLLERVQHFIAPFVQ
jgi:hypothetical protein